MKIPNPYFENVPGVGDLVMEQVLEEYVYPLLSVLRDKKANRYLCICFDTRGAQQWILTKISERDLCALLANHLEICSPFLSDGQESILIKLDYHTRKESYQFYTAANVPLECIPERGELLESDDGTWDEYICKLTKSMITNVPVKFTLDIVVTPSFAKRPTCRWKAEKPMKSDGEVCYA